MKLDNICIVGGGSAGWMTAAVFARHFEGKKKITVVESPNIGTIGVGESTTQHFNTFKRYLGLVDEEWMPACDATYKNSIRCERWGTAKPFHYPFGDYDTNLSHLDWWHWRQHRDVDAQEFGKMYSNAAAVAETGKLYTPHIDYEVGYHIDAVKFANYLRDEYCIPRGVKHIQATVGKIDVESGHIQRIYLDGDVRFLKADLFIDCTGFRAILMNALNVEWISWHNELLNDSTWAIRKPYTNKEEELTAYTRVTAMSSGWTWTVPTFSRIGTGYNYSSKFQSKEDALKEFKQFTGLEHLDDSEFRHLSWPTGIRRQPWSGNCVAIGLSAGFIEPLESGGLFSVHEFLFSLIQFINSDTQYTNGMMRDYFNNACWQQLGAFKDFVVYHYTLAQKGDTPYWETATNVPFKPINNFDPKELFSINDLFKGVAYLLGGMGYKIVGPRESMNAKDHYGYDFDTEYIRDIIYNRVSVQVPEAIANSPVPLDYYQSTLYKEQLS